MEKKHVISSAGKVGFVCTCGQKFASESQGVKHADDANFEMHEQAKEAAAKPKTEPAAAAPAAPAAKPAEKPADKPAEQTNHSTGEITEAPAPTRAAPKATSKVQAFLDNADVRARFENLLDKRAGQFITSLTALVSTNGKLAECSPASFLSAAVTAAALDLPVNPNLGFAYIIPYNDKKLGMVAQFQMGYKGFIQLAQRSGQYKTISAIPVYEGQLVDENPISGNTYNWKGRSSDKVVGYLAYFKLLSGFEKEMFMTYDEAQAHGGRYSQSYKTDKAKGWSSSLWSSEFDTMATKTVLKLLISKFGPMSTDTHMQMAVERDQSVTKDDGVIEYVDNTDELQDAINACSTKSELNDFIKSLPVEDRKTVANMAEERLKALAE